MLETGILSYPIAGVELYHFLILIGLALFAWGVGLTVSFILERVARRCCNNTSLYAIVIRSLSKPIKFSLVLVGIFIGMGLFPKEGWVEKVYPIASIIIKACSIWVVIWFLLLLTDGIADRFAEKAKDTDSKIDDMLTPIVKTVVKFLLIAFGILVILQNLGYSVTSLIAGLGLGGAAIALAAKDTIANVFGSLVVFLDKPFELGDWVNVNGVEGSVEEIRLRTTLIRTFDNTLVTMPNSLLTNTNIDNFERRNKRKMDCSFGLHYQTTHDQVVAIVEDIKKHLNDNPEIFDSPHWVALEGFGDSNLNITVIAYSRATLKGPHMEVKQAFMLTILRIIEKHGTGFAYPTRSINIDSVPEIFHATKKV